MFLPLASGNLTTLHVPPPSLPLPIKKIDLNIEISNIKRSKKQTFVEELEQVFRINCRFIRESTLT